jgi:hypothetical protein
LFVSSSLIFGLWTIVCLFVFNSWFVDQPKIKDEEKNYGTQTND